MGNNEKITLDQQRAMGLRPQAGNYVPARIDRRAAPPLPINSEINMTIDAPPAATQHIEFRSSAVDRAKGFLIASVPLYAGFAFVVLLVSIFFAGVPFLSLSALIIFWLSFVAAWIVGYGWTLSVSAEGVSFFEARQKWDVIKEEQRRRWAHYDKLMEVQDDES
jgi:hypothetical protein